jgi:hypothetical protein
VQRPGARSGTYGPSSAGSRRPGESLRNGDPLLSDRTSHDRTSVVEVPALRDHATEIQRVALDAVVGVRGTPAPGGPIRSGEFDHDRVSGKRQIVDV